MNNKFYYLTTNESEKLNQDIEAAYGEIEKLKLEEIGLVLDKLEPQQKLFFLEKVLTDLSLRSQMPVFFIVGLLSKISDFIKTLDGKDMKENMEEKRYASYLG